MIVAVTGASGFVGSALVPRLVAAGHRVVRIGRGADADVRWDPSSGRLDASRLAGVEAAINLAGESIAQRWSAQHKRAIRDSRVNGTRLISEGLASLAQPPKVLISASAIGIYGDRRNETLDESSPPGRGFLPEVALQWEAAADPARRGGIRVVHPRFGIILGPGGGALAKLLPIFTVGAGGKIASGDQWMSWVARDDVLGALEFVMQNESLSGPVNFTSPAPVTNARFAEVLGHVLHRPALATVPALAVKLLYGEMARLVITGQRAVPRRPLEWGYEFRHPQLDEALRSVLR